MKSRASAAGAFVLALALAFAGLAAPSSAHAVILGFYGSAGTGSSDWDDSGLDRFDDHMDTRHSGVGFVMGTGGPAWPLSYRMSIGYEQISHLGDSDTPDFTMHGVVVDQDLLLSLSPRRGQAHLWFGPELRLGYLNGDPDDGSSGEQDFFVLGLGPVLGVDFKVSPAVALSWKLGYLVSAYSGDNRHRGDGNGDADLVEGHAYASLSVLFSTWGGYREAPVRELELEPEPGPQSAPRYYPRRRY